MYVGIFPDSLTGHVGEPCSMTAVRPFSLIAQARDDAKNELAYFLAYEDSAEENTGLSPHDRITLPHPPPLDPPVRIVSRTRHPSHRAPAGAAPATP